MEESPAEQLLIYWYITTLYAIERGDNLAAHAQSVGRTLTTLDELIAQARQKGIDPQGLMDMQNQVYYLKYLLNERL